MENPERVVPLSPLPSINMANVVAVWPEKHMPSIESINMDIQLQWINANEVSDGYHTFGELYAHRITLWIAYCRIADGMGDANGQIAPWRSKFHSDGGLAFGGGWFVLGIDREPGKQITYHLPESYWDDCDFAQTLDRAPEWDGHTSADVLERIKNL